MRVSNEKLQILIETSERAAEMVAIPVKVMLDLRDARVMLVERDAEIVHLREQVDALRSRTITDISGAEG